MAARATERARHLPEHQFNEPKLMSGVRFHSSVFQ
jgi:hypothetical protein